MGWIAPWLLEIVKHLFGRIMCYDPESATLRLEITIIPRLELAADHLEKIDELIESRVVLEDLLKTIINEENSSKETNK